MTTAQTIVLIVYFCGIPIMALLQGLCGTVWKNDKIEITIISLLWPITIIMYALFGAIAGVVVVISTIFSGIFSIPATFGIFIRKKFINWRKPVEQSFLHYGD